MAVWHWKKDWTCKTCKHSSLQHANGSKSCKLNKCPCTRFVREK